MTEADRVTIKNLKKLLYELLHEVLPNSRKFTAKSTELQEVREPRIFFEKCKDCFTPAKSLFGMLVGCISLICTKLGASFLLLLVSDEDVEDKLRGKRLL